MTAVALLAMMPLPLAMFHDGLLAPCFAMLIAILAACPEFLGRAFWPVMGEASFGIYLWHIPIWHGIEYLRLDHSRWAYPFYLILVISISVAAYYSFEKPARKWILATAERRKLAAESELGVAVA